MRLSTQSRYLESATYSEKVVPRLCENDVLLASDNSRLSILRISRVEGYAQYGGMPVIVESDFRGRIAPLWE